MLTLDDIPPAAQDLFDYSMTVQDLRYDPYYNFIWYFDNGPWSVRFTAWYSVGLLKRNQGDDVAHARAALKNMYEFSRTWTECKLIQLSLACQYTGDLETAWFGTFKLSPDGELDQSTVTLELNLLLEPDPTPDSELYPPKIYAGTPHPRFWAFTDRTSTGNLRPQLEVSSARRSSQRALPSSSRITFYYLGRSVTQPLNTMLLK